MEGIPNPVDIIEVSKDASLEDVMLEVQSKLDFKKLNHLLLSIAARYKRYKMRKCTKKIILTLISKSIPPTHLQQFCP